MFSKGIVKLSETDALAAATFLDAHPVPGMSMDIWKTVAEHWAATDPYAAIDWAMHQKEFAARRASMQGMISGWWQSDPDGAGKYAQESIKR